MQSTPYVYHVGWNAAEFPMSGVIYSDGAYNWYLTGGYYLPDASGTINGIYFSSAARTLANIWQGLSGHTFNGSFDAIQDKYIFSRNGGATWSHLSSSANANYAFGLSD